MDQAVKRRLAQELGIDCPLTYLYKFKYNAKYGSLGSEREFCWVYYGHHEGDLDVNLNEVADWRFVDVESLDAELAASADRFTPWLRLEWAELKEAYLDDILVAID
jgi:isopentenyl-diphosphate delta-isomerase